MAAIKGFFKTIKNEVKKEFNKQIDQVMNPGGKSDDPEHAQKKDFSAVEGVLNLFSGSGGTNAVANTANSGGGGDGEGGGGGQKSGLQQILGVIQGAGGILPGLKLDGLDKLLPTVMKVAEIIGKGMGDDTPRTDTNDDGSSVDEFVKTLIDGRKIHSGTGSKRVMELNSANDFLSTIPRLAKLDSKGQANVSRVTGFVYGFLSVLLGFSAQYMGSVYTASFQAVGATNGVITGIFIAGLFMPYINATGAKAGVLVALTSMLAIGGRNIFSTAMKEPILPTGIDNCPPDFISVTAIYNSTTYSSQDFTIEWPERIFTLSYLMYPIVGASILLLVATSVSLCTGGFWAEKSSVPQAYLHPFVRRNSMDKKCVYSGEIKVVSAKLGESKL